MEGLSLEEQVAASAVAALCGHSTYKRNRDDSPDYAGGGGSLINKRARTTVADVPAAPAAGPIEAPVVAAPPAAAASEPTSETDKADPKPYPFFYYEDFSKVQDPDTLTPLTPPGRVPNFPAKMHSILSRPDLADIICWMPHGRSWRVLKPREFEIKVIPTYFEHSKFSSFIRQANGWGFRRVTQGRDRNSYYHPMFLRGLPHLCKEMKRPGVAGKVVADPEHEPDFYKISESFPVPEKAEDDSILLQCTLQGGPKARMPIYSGALSSLSSLTSTTTAEVKPTVPAAKPTIKATDLTPRDQSSLDSFHQALGASEGLLKSLAVTSPKQEPVSKPITLPAPALVSANEVKPPSFNIGNGNNKVSPLAAASQLAFTSPSPIPNMAAAQFAAGFAAATVLNQQQLRNMLGTFAFVPSATAATAQVGPAPQPQAPAAHGFHFLKQGL